MKTQELPLADSIPSPANLTPKDRIEDAVNIGHISSRGGDVLMKLHSAEMNPTPEDVARHEEMMRQVLSHAASLGKAYTENRDKNSQQPQIFH